MGTADFTKPGSNHVQAALDEFGLTITVRRVSDSTRTAEDAARVIGCAVAQIVKSLVFRGCQTGRPYLILVSGTNRVNEHQFSARVEEKIERANPEFVREQTGFSIGGVPPLGHPAQLSTWMDEDLLQFETVWAAAGSPHAVFPISPQDLARVTSAEVIRV
jgi:prolyl-tRNA editing enzyme YbaK/EbsC (Cys-tRNA(Pro) deacylase)